jgi:hypothetical protein
MTLDIRGAAIIALAAATTACATRVRPTTYFVPVNQWEQLTDCILVASIERGYSTRLSTLGIHVKRPPKGKPGQYLDINRPPTGMPNPLRREKPGVEGKPVVEEEVFYERTIIPEGIVLKAQSRALDRTANYVAGTGQGPRSKVAPSAHIQGAQRELEKACMKDVQLFMGKPTGQVAATGQLASPAMVASREY